MALKNLALSYSGFWQGKMASAHGYARTLLIDGIGAAVPVLVLLFLWPARRQGLEPPALAPGPALAGDRPPER
jgi:hypothetical protein